MASKSLFLFFSILTLNSLVPRTSAALSFSVELIHRDHPKSPLYNPNLSHADRVHEAVHRSNIRAKALTKSFFSKAFDPSLPNNNIEMRIMSADYLMSINVGTPPKEIIATADTGSDLIWATCKPCKDCYKQDAPLFDPSASSSYSNLPCNSTQCVLLPDSQCDQSSNCIYLYGYGDKSVVLGNLGQETLTFNTTAGSTVNFPDVSFGCTHEATGIFPSNSAGLVGLGAGPLSLISQLGSAINHQFSYCLVPQDKANTITSKLSFGSDATISSADVEVTNMVNYTDQPSFYTVTLDGIMVGKNTLSDFKNNYNMIFDSGTILTYLDKSVHDSLVKTLSSTISLPQITDDTGVFALCFNDSNAGFGSIYPDITLKIGKATMVLKPYNAFIKYNDNVTCLAMKVAEPESQNKTSLSILGNIAQQNFHVGYDLGARKISFAPADCTNF